MTSAANQNPNLMRCGLVTFKLKFSVAGQSGITPVLSELRGLFEHELYFGALNLNWK